MKLLADSVPKSISAGGYCLGIVLVGEKQEHNKQPLKFGHGEEGGGGGHPLAAKA